MRLAFGGLWHQTNTFSPVRTTPEDFIRLPEDESRAPCSGPLAFRQTVRAIRAAAHATGTTLVSILVAGAQSSGVVSAGMFDGLVGAMVNELGATTARIDGVILCLSGGLVTETDDDGDATVVERVRHVIGADVPFGVILGPSANLSPRLVGAADVVVALDGNGDDDRARLSAMLAALSTGRRSFPELVKVSLLLPPAATDSPEFDDLRGRARSLRSTAGVADVAVTAGFPFADVAHAGAGVLVYADDAARAARAASDLAGAVWSARAMLAAPVTNLEIAVHLAMDARSGTTLLLDTGDDPGMGGPGDGTALLWALLDLGVERAVLGFFHDPAVVAQAIAAGPRNRLRLAIGGRHDRRHGYPIEIDATVTRISDGKLSLAADDASRGAPFGRIAIVRANGRHGGEVDILVSERRLGFADPALFSQLGVDLTTFPVVAVKGGSWARRAFERLGMHVIQVATPGVTVPDFEFYDFHKIPRPIFPLDPI